MYNLHHKDILLLYESTSYATNCISFTLNATLHAQIILKVINILKQLLHNLDRNS